jgi:glycine cleavage system aminomethyltransferase T
MLRPVTAAGMHDGMLAGRIIVDDQPIDFVVGDSVAMAAIRAGQHPATGGTLCLSGDCGNCCAVVNSTPWVRTCQTRAMPGLTVRRQPAAGAPLLDLTPPRNAVAPSIAAAIDVEHIAAVVVVIGAGDSGTDAAAAASAAGHEVMVLDANEGNEVVGVYAGPTVIVRTDHGMRHIHAESVVVATGAAELQPACDGNLSKGIFTRRAAEALVEAGIVLDRAYLVTEQPLRIIADDNGWVCGVVTRGPGRGQPAEPANPAEVATPCRTLIVDLGQTGRDLLSRMTDDPAVSVVGPAAQWYPLPPCPRSGVVCSCSKVTVEDLDGVWSRGFHELELVKRAALFGTGTCQGGVCLPYLRSFVADRSGTIPEPFTARPISRQLTIGEAAAGSEIDAFRRTPLHDEHLRLGAQMDRFGGWWRPWNYGDPRGEYWAVREAVSVGDVSTLGKMVVSGPDAVEVLERLYPNHVHDIKVGRSRYMLLLNERGHLLDDGMICRESATRFVLTFTSGGASFAEMWVRDWVETWGLDCRILDRTAALAAINVTGPFAAELLGRVGVIERPKFLQHVHGLVAGVPAHIIRLSFTGEASFELHHARHRSVELWRALIDAGGDLGIRPHGLQALFGLRLEKGHVIVGMDTELDSTPRRLGMEWAVKMDKVEFVGREALTRIRPLPDHRRLFGLTMDSPAPVEGAPIYDGETIVGHVSSSFDSPLLGRAVMLGWVKRTPFPDSVTINARPAVVTATPFYDPEGLRARA